LAELKNLSVLLLSKIDPVSQINDISPLAALTNLSVLNLGGNQIDDISHLAALTNLTNLALTNNRVSDISILAGLANLSYLDLRYNPIDAGQIEELRSLLPTTEIRADY
jgi:internalin A